MLSFDCEHCGEHLHAHESRSGQSLVCGLCGRTSTVPGREPPPAPPPALRPPDRASAALAAVLATHSPEPANPSVLRSPVSAGTLLGGLGVLVAGYFFFAFDPSVPTEFGRVNNIGLMQDRQNGLIIGCVLFLAGIVVEALKQLPAHQRAMPAAPFSGPLGAAFTPPVGGPPPPIPAPAVAPPGSDAREQHRARLRQLAEVHHARPLTETEWWEVASRSSAMGHTQAAERALAAAQQLAELRTASVVVQPPAAPGQPGFVHEVVVGAAQQVATTAASQVIGNAVQGLLSWLTNPNDR